MAAINPRSSLRERFARGDALTGIIDFIGAPMVIEILARAGIDFVIIDMEHCPTDMERLAHLVRAADAAGIAPLVRIPEVDPGLIKRVLNLDVAGLVIPHGTRASCEALVRAARYAPDGERGACPIVRATGYWPDDWKAYAEQANRDVMLLPLIEDAAAIEDIAAIAAVPGINGLFVGPYDLSVSVGAPGADFDHPAMSSALDRVVASCRRHGKLVLTTIGDRQERDYSRRLVARGVQGLVLATDALVLLQACRRLVEFAR
ncbi:MAG TPA: aldolase/citrate lyase family protein [Xanthobacteraceae bacterium]|jgi:4-hydroxy-2-oxoheptanedioate aldolase|nr:aldolase/citrate lyase family protein [Xanthobacteraceae bacterium]